MRVFPSRPRRHGSLFRTLTFITVLVGASSTYAQPTDAGDAGDWSSLMHGRTPATRRSAADRLGRSGDQGAVAGLVTCLQHDAVASVRLACARALGRIAANSAREPLERARHDSDPGVRRAAARALHAIATGVPFDCRELPLAIEPDARGADRLFRCPDGVSRRGPTRSPE